MMGVSLCRVSGGHHPWPLLGPVPLVSFVQQQAFEASAHTDVRGRSDPLPLVIQNPISCKNPSSHARPVNLQDCRFVSRSDHISM
jgi:hypothetical protein